MTRESTKKKRDKKRAEKKKHAHLTEQMAEEHAKKRRAHREEVVAILVMLAFVPFMLIGVVWWPASSSTGKAKSNSGLSDGTYIATYIGGRPASGEDAAVVALDVNGETFFVDESDLAGDAAENPGAFFEGRRGQAIEITVKNGFITGWTPTAGPQ